MREKTIEEYLTEQWASRTGGESIKFPPLFYAGFPDRICLAPGAVIAFAETKAPGKFAAKLQDYILAKLRRWGFTAEVLDTHIKVDQFIDKICARHTFPTRTK